jgi:hypothetical protein
MVRPLLFILPCLLLIFCSTRRSESPERFNIERIAGTWFNKSYIDTLIQTRSLSKASSTTHTPTFSISHKDSTYTWVININFHEGIFPRIDRLEKTSESRKWEVISSHLNTNYFSFPSTNLDTLIWHSGSEQPESYIRTDGYKIINELLTGQYIDSAGKLFTIDSNRKFSSSLMNFNFEVGLDYVMAKCDYIDIKNRKDEKGYPLRYGFRLTADSLFLYPVDYEWGEILRCSEKPFLALRKK